MSITSAGRVLSIMSIKDKKIQVVVSDFEIGAGKIGASKGPLALLNALNQIDVEFDSPVFLNNNSDSNDQFNTPFCKHIFEIEKASVLLNSEIENQLKHNRFPLILSGDHSNAIGGLSGVKNAYPDKRIGVIWVDAHADLHSPYTTPSGNMHGMPLAALINTDNVKFQKNQISEEEAKAWNRLKSIGSSGITPKVMPEDIVFIGIRDAEEEEWGLIEEFKIKTFEPHDIKEHGIFYAINNALKYLESCDLIYVSFDVDSMDPSVSVGTGTVVSNGLTFTEAEAVFKAFLNHPKLVAFEITEINPSLDQDGNKMANVVAALLNSVLK